MPRTLSIDDTLLGHHEKLQRTKSFETGLLLAQAGAKADTLVRFVPTPEQEEGVKAVVVDPDWMLEHAVQVSRMLPGGVVVLGCYVFASNAKLAPQEAKLQQVLHAIAKRLPPSVSEPHAVLLLLPSDAKKVVCKSCAAAPPVRLQPLDLKTSPKPPELVCFACDWQVDLTLWLHPAAASASASHVAQLAEQLGAIEAELSSALATVDGALPSEGMLTTAPGASGSLTNPHRVHFFTTSPTTALRPQAGAAAAVRLVGVVHGRAFVLARSEVSSALAELRRDVSGALRARIPLLLEQLADEDEDEEDDEDEGGGAHDGASSKGSAGRFDLDARATHALPRRAHVPVSTNLSLCDYLGAHEDASDVAERVQALLGHAMQSREGDDGDRELGPEAVPLVATLADSHSALPAPGTARTSSSSSAVKGGAGGAKAGARGGGGGADSAPASHGGAVTGALGTRMILPTLIGLGLLGLALALVLRSPVEPGAQHGANPLGAHHGVHSSVGGVLDAAIAVAGEGAPRAAEGMAMGGAVERPDAP